LLFLQHNTVPHDLRNRQDHYAEEEAVDRPKLVTCPILAPGNATLEVTKLPKATSLKAFAAAEHSTARPAFLIRLAFVAVKGLTSVSRSMQRTWCTAYRTAAVPAIPKRPTGNK
jgi:hypothetical protein